jgi:hypothetical protein
MMVQMKVLFGRRVTARDIGCGTVTWATKTKGEVGREDTGEDKGQGSLWRDGGVVNVVNVVADEAGWTWW